MQKTTSEIYGPIYSIIKQMQNASPDEKERLEAELYLKSEEAFKEFESFDSEFARIRNANLELEEKICNLNELLDQKMSEMSELDMGNSLANCEIIYKGFWEKLDSYSQKYLVMANYLFNLFSNKDKDFSPSVLEFGRAVENELVRKIYFGYVASLSGHTEGMIDHGSLYGALKNAIRSYTNNGEYYIPAREMVKYLSYLSEQDLVNAYNDALKKYLNEHHINIESISETSFTNNADEIFDKYRNTAAHPGEIIPSSDAKACREKSKKVLKRFMTAVD